MLIFYQMLLFLELVYCRINLNREGITVYSGQPVTLKCSWDYKGRLFWIRLVPGKLPVVLGKTFGSKTADHRIRITEETQASFLRIWRTITSDTGYYYCMIYYHELTFAKEIHLSVEGLKSSTVADISPHVVHPGASAILQCSHDSDFSNNMFLGQHSKCCCRSSSVSAHAPFTPGNINGTSADTKAGFLIKKPLCCSMKDSNTSDVFFCTVSSCEDGVGGYAPEQDNNGSANNWLWEDKGALSLSLAALALSLIVNACCIYSIRKYKTKREEAAIPLQQTASTAEVDQQPEEDSLVYSAPNFSLRKCRERPEEHEECWYTEVRRLGLNEPSSSGTLPVH